MNHLHFIFCVLCGLAMIYTYRNIINLVWSTPHSFKANPGFTSDAENSIIYQVKRVRTVNCQRIFANDSKEIKTASMYYTTRQAVQHAGENIWKMTRTCEQFKKRHYPGHYVTTYVSSEELEFPLAFSILLYKDVVQVERLLRAIYRPHNYYCLHVDKKAEEDVHVSIRAFARCFDNVFLSSRSVDVHWGFFSVIEPDLICMEDLLKYKKWKYFINLTGQEFPLKTNAELVHILKYYRGANDIRGTPFSELPEEDRLRITYEWKEGVGRTAKLLPTFPHNITFAKGSVHITAARKFVEFVINNPIAREFREWCKKTGHASEHYFNSLQFSPQLGVPNAYIGPAKGLETLNRFKEFQHSTNRTCHGKFVHGICIIGVGDLPDLYRSDKLFVNKLHQSYQPIAYDCLEEWHYNKTLSDQQGTTVFNTTRYKNLEFAKYFMGQTDIHD